MNSLKYLKIIIRFSLRLFLFVVIVSSCSTTSKTLKDSSSKYRIVQIEIEEATDSINELRFYDISSAYDAAAMMRQYYGKANGKKLSRYQENINSFIWKDLKLTEEIDGITIITDGTETQTDYFSNLKIIDSYGRDCLSDNYEGKVQIIDTIIKKMKHLDTRYIGILLSGK